MIWQQLAGRAARQERLEIKVAGFTLFHEVIIAVEEEHGPEPGALQKRVDELSAAHIAAGKPPFRLKTVPQGAATSVWAGVVASADKVGGRHCEDCHIADPLEGEEISPISAGVRPYALDPEHARALWRKSEKMVGERF
jgi:hypothetical protein